MKLKIVLVSFLCFFASFSNAAQDTAQTGPFVSTINRLQVKGIGNPYNSVMLNLDITTSPCGSTNALNRFTITNNAQLSVVLAAVMSNKEVIIYGMGAPCNGAEIEDISAIIIKP